MSLSPEALYLQLGRLIEEMPDLRTPNQITPEIYRWLGRAAALVEASGDKRAYINLTICAQGMTGLMQDANAGTIAALLHTALAKAEMSVPAAAKGAFIPAGSTLDAFAAVGKVLDTVKRDVLFVDPYADEKLLTEYALLAAAGISLRLLAGDTTCKATLKPAAVRWTQQYGDSRPLAVRLAAAKTLHDRLILIDGSTAWILGQSFNKLAVRAHTSISRLEPEPGTMKIAAYADLWQGAKPL